jgi:type I restriction enzyme M protein
MKWIAPSEKDTVTEALEKRLWAAAEQFRANSGLKSQEYSLPVLGLSPSDFGRSRQPADSFRVSQGNHKNRLEKPETRPDSFCLAREEILASL